MISTRKAQKRFLMSCMDISGCAATELTLPLLLLVGFARTPIVGQGTADVDEQREKKRSEDAVYAEGVKRETSDECENQSRFNKRKANHCRCKPELALMTGDEVLERRATSKINSNQHEIHRHRQAKNASGKDASCERNAGQMVDDESEKQSEYDEARHELPKEETSPRQKCHYEIPFATYPQQDADGCVGSRQSETVRK